MTLHSFLIRLISVLLTVLAVTAHSAVKPVSPGAVPVFAKVAGEVRPVAIERGDTLIAFSARHGVRVGNIMRDNEITDPRKLKPGQTLNIDTRRLIPELTDNGLVADIAAAMLYRFDGGELVARYPAGFGSPARQTPTGTFTILFADHDASWGYPAGVMEEKEREATIVKQRTPPSGELSLGPYWIQLSTWGMGIHPTPFPSTIGRFMGHTHIRVSEANCAELTGQIKTGIKLESVYHPVRLAITADGAIWAEAHPDVYELGLPTEVEILEALGDSAIGVELEKLRAVLAEKHGVATEVGRLEASGNENIEAKGNGHGDLKTAKLSCIDCPPGPERRVTFRIEALEAITLDSDFPVQVRDEAGKVVYHPESGASQTVSMEAGASRNLVWECNDTEGQPLPPGSYTASIAYSTIGGDSHTLSVPIWLGN